MGAKQKKWAYIEELSSKANELLRKFGHFYATPFASMDFSASSTTVGIAGALIAIVGVFNGFWWGILIGVVNWFAMGALARAFNPTNFLLDDDERIAHEEVLEWLSTRRKENVLTD